MEIVEHDLILSSSLNAAWEKMVDWRDWPSWDGGMEAVKFEGTLAGGSVGELKLKDGPSVTLAITDFNLHRSYTSEFSLLGTRFIFGHILTPLDGGRTKLTVTAQAEGVTSFLIGNIARAKIARGVPIWMDSFQSTLNEITPAKHAQES